MNKKLLFTIILKSALIIILSIFSVSSCISVSREYLHSSFSDFIIFSSAWLFSLIGLIMLSLMENSFQKILLVIIFAIFGLFIDLNYTIMGDTITVEAMSFLWSEKSYFSQAVSMYWILSIIPLCRMMLYIAVSLYPVKSLSGKIKWRKISVPLIAAIFLIYHFSSKIDGKGIDGLPAYISPLPFFASVLKVNIEYKVTPRREVEIPLVGQGKIDNIVVIVDESIRGDFIDLNYLRHTTPYLLTIKDQIINYGLAMSSYNRSNGSNAILRMGIGPAEFSGPNGRALFSNPLIWQYAHKAGYKTIFMDAQMDRFNDYMDSDEARYIDSLNWVKSRDGKESKDHAAAWKLRELIKTPGKKLIYLVKMGAHFHYEGAYPAEQRIFSPVMEQGVPTTDREKLVNSYRNAIRWNVNEFFKILLTDISLKNTVIIYTSDHAQNLFDDKTRDTMLLHGRSKNSIPQEAIVPMLVFTNDENMRRLFGSMVSVNHNKCTHYQIFPTVLYMMGYDKKRVVDEYFQTLFDPVSAPVGYTEGNVRFGKHILKKVDPDLTKYIDPELMNITK